jgi:hypothetical protein
MSETTEQLGSSMGIGGPIELVKEIESKKKAEWLAPYQYKKGQSGNPQGRRPGKSLKEYAKEKLLSMTDEEREEFLNGIDKRTIWEMTEGKAKQDLDVRGNLTISQVLDQLQNGQSAIE